MRRVVDTRAWLPRTLLCALPLFAAAAFAQQDDVPPPPRLDAPNRRPTAAAQPERVRAPESARLAPLPEERGPATEEIVVVGGSEWRLPDLGSDWRAERDAEQARARVRLLPLYDPENQQVRSDLFLLNKEAQRIGYIELFRVRFGRRSTD